MSKSKDLKKIKIPNVENFTMEYYIANQADMQNAHVYPPHLHDELEIYILLEGDASFMVEKNLYKLSPGDAIISKPNEMHNCILNSNSIHKHLCFWFEITPVALFTPFLSAGNFISPTEEDKKRLFYIYQELDIANTRTQTNRQAYLALEMLDIFSRYLGVSSKPVVIPEKLYEILDDINKNFTEINTLDYFTEKYFISQSTLNRLFRQHLNTSPKTYLETKRLAYSRILLKEGKSVFDACMLAGFPDYSNYIRLFKTRFGITPKRYRDG